MKNSDMGIAVEESPRSWIVGFEDEGVAPSVRQVTNSGWRTSNVRPSAMYRRKGTKGWVQQILQVIGIHRPFFQNLHLSAIILPAAGSNWQR